MKTYIKYIILIIVTLIIGMLIGKYFFSSPVNEEQHDTAHQDHTGEAKETIYTCSMHPQIRQNEPGICPICEMDLVSVDDMSASDDPTVLQMTKEAVKLAQVETYTVGDHGTSGGSSKPVQVEGEILLDERLSNVQTSHISGRLEKLYVNFTGEYVKAGQLIAEIYSPELLAASKELLTAIENEDRFPGLKKAALEKLKNWKISDATIENIQENGKPLERVNLYADFSGYVTDKKVSNGDHLMEGEALYSLSSTGQVWAVFNVFESDLAGITTGQKISFTTPSVPGKSYAATISYIDPVLNSITRSVPVRATIANRSGKLKPGMLIKGKIMKTSGEKNEKLIIPKTAVLWTGQRSVVYVQQADSEIPTFEYREVSLGESKGEYFEVLDGLDIGEDVVTNGAFSIDAAAQLSNKKSMINQNVSIKSDPSPFRTKDYSQNISKAFKDQVNQVIDQYLLIKDALVDTDANTTADATNQFREYLQKVDMTEVSGEGHDYWMEQLNVMNAHTKKIVESTDIERQRHQFEFLSDAMINTVRSFKIGHDTLYVQYCPMAFDNKGADWLSSDEFIRNPYFGDKMLKCGTVTNTYTFNQ